jgi:hypothetical protein
MVTYPPSLICFWYKEKKKKKTKKKNLVEKKNQTGIYPRVGRKFSCSTFWIFGWALKIWKVP